MAAATTAVLTVGVVVSFFRWRRRESEMNREKWVREDAMIMEIKQIWIKAKRLDVKEPLLDYLIHQAGGVENLLENVRNKYEFESTNMCDYVSEEESWIRVGRSANVGR